MTLKWCRFDQRYHKYQQNTAAKHTLQTQVLLVTSQRFKMLFFLTAQFSNAIPLFPTSE